MTLLSDVNLRATAIVAASGLLWGLYWLPVWAIEDRGLAGAWGTAAITVLAAALLAPVAWRQRAALLAASPLALVSVAVGGLAFGLYSVSLVYGRVAIVILLYFLTPVWSTLIARYLLGWPVTRLRLASIGVGLLGLFAMLGAGGAVPVPRGTGEWMGLIAGILWSVGTTGIRTRSVLPPGASAFVFALGAAAGALALAPILAPWPGPSAEAGVILALTAATAALWWGLSIALLLWATARLEPARVGILLMTEVLVGALSAALIAGEALSSLEMAGGALVLTAGIMEVWPRRARG